MQIYADVDAETHDKIAAKFSEAISSFEKNFVVGPDGNSSVAPTGELYIEVTSSGIRPKGEEFPHVDDFITGTRVKGHVVHSTFESAIEAWSAAVSKMVPDVPSTLYWRIRPEIDLVDLEIDAHNGKFIFPKSQWKIYSRLLVSCK